VCAHISELVENN